MIRDLLFKFFFYFGVIIVLIIFLPALLLPNKIVLLGGKLLGFWSSFCLKVFLSTQVVVKGREKILNDEKFFIACSHQSMFETFYLQAIFNSPIFILKNELLKIPIFGWYLKKINSVSVNRDKVSRENLGIIDKIKYRVNNTDRPIVIFPQATRVLPNDRSSFKKGVGRIYAELGIKCQPLAINSGIAWPKKGSLVPNQTITISILEPIQKGMQPNDFINLLEQRIYNELDVIS